MELAERTGIDTKLLLCYASIAGGKYYYWNKRYCIGNQHNAKVPRGNCLLEDEKQSIIGYAKNHMEEGYRRLTYMMIDDEIAFASPSSVYPLLRQAGLLMRYAPSIGGGKGKAYIQPEAPHQECHIDISYINVRVSFIFLIAIIDGYCRFIVHYDLEPPRKKKM